VVPELDDPGGSMAPKWTKSELEGKTLPKLKGMADVLGIAYSAKETKAKLVTSIMKAKDKLQDSPRSGNVGGSTHGPQAKDKLQDAPAWPVKDRDPKASEYRTWAREAQVWRRMSTEAGHTENSMYLSLMRQLPADVKEQVYAELDDKDLSLTGVIKLLERDYKGADEIEGRSILEEYRSLKRGDNESLEAFLKKYRRVRNKALNQNIITASEADYHDLLKATQLGTSEHTMILLNLKKAKLNDHFEKLEFVLDELKVIVELQAMNYKEFEKAPVALVAEQAMGVAKQIWGRPGGKGRGAKGEKKGLKGKAGGDRPGKGCKGGQPWQAGPSGKGSKGNQGRGKKGLSKGLGKGGKGHCWQWQETGECPYGENCRFEHVKKEEQGHKRGAGGQDGPAKRSRLH